MSKILKSAEKGGKNANFEEHIWVSICDNIFNHISENWKFPFFYFSTHSTDLAKCLQTGTLNSRGLARNRQKRAYHDTAG